MTIHDYAEFESKVRAEGIPQPTLHWAKNGQKIEADEFKQAFAIITESQVASDIRLDHFGVKDAGEVCNRSKYLHILGGYLLARVFLM